jgi:hypothetical protein
LYLKTKSLICQLSGGQVLAERNISRFYNVEQRNDSCDAVLPVEGKERLVISDKVYFIETFDENTFSE